MQFSIDLFQSESSLIGEVPLLYQIKEFDWNHKKDKVLQHCIDLMIQKSEKNVVVLWDSDCLIRNVEDDIKRVFKEKTNVTYSSKQIKDETLNIKQFVEKSDHILVTGNRYFLMDVNVQILYYFLVEMKGLQTVRRKKRKFYKI